MITPEEYSNALQVVKQYREERGFEFYIPLNYSISPENITMDEFRLFINLQNTLK